ncbi:MAG: hypothetical protein ACK4PH_00600 [Aquincola tertiaricarbonis]|uniref:hypothetical protein n=1 Tax=Aquincola tertiaricarbonis TaxID=391953 RepID=UPI0012EDD5F6|nr:hypothetical protein [Aquincola tertiaricarbonis]
MAQSQINAAAAQAPQQVRTPAPQAGAPVQKPAAPLVLDERMLGQVTGGLPRVGGW